MPEVADKDACDLLDADHLAVKHLFVEYARLAYAPADSSSRDARGEIALQICDELTVHAQIEEEIFYPALRDAVPAASDVLEEAHGDHAAAKALIAQVRDLGQPGERMDQAIAELARVIEDHVKDERDELFPKARAAAGLDLVALGTELKKRQQELVPAPLAGEPV